MRRASEDAKMQSGTIRSGTSGRHWSVATSEPEDTSCGLGAYRPSWMQQFATAQFFVINFSIVGILQGAMFTYMVGILSTIEKRFAFDTKISGFILIADNLSQMFVSPIVGYLGSKYNRSKLIAIGEMVVAISCLMNAIPFLMYGPGVHLLTKNVDATIQGDNGTSTSYDLCAVNSTEGGEDCSDGGYSTIYLAVAILWLSSFANGLGYTAFYTVGLPYIDDNIQKKNSPMYLSSISTLRLLGPALGFVLSSFCLSLYEDPFMDPGITNKDPRWVGAWWLGFIILGAAILVCAFPMFMFPTTFKEMNATKIGTEGAVISQRKKKKTAEKGKFADAFDAFKRMSKNPLLLYHMFGGVFRIIGYFGYYINKPKYMELQYRQSASSASFFTGATSVITMAVGTMAGGVAIRYIKPKARSIAIFICLVELFSGMGILSAMFMNCPAPEFADVGAMSCNSDCGCGTQVFQPVCGADGKTNYFSPCYAGCRDIHKIDGKIVFDNCSCIGNSTSQFLALATGNSSLSSLTTSSISSALLGDSYARNGKCEDGCEMFPYYITILSVCNMIASTARTGDTLLILRAVDSHDKSFAMGVMGSVFAVFAYIPYPLIFGAIIDSTCLIWESSCGTQGNCWLYDIEKFRVYFHISAFAFVFVGILLEIGTIVHAGKITNFYGDDEPTNVDDMERRTGNGNDTGNKRHLELVDITKMSFSETPECETVVVKNNDENNGIQQQ